MFQSFEARPREAVFQAFRENDSPSAASPPRVAPACPRRTLRVSARSVGSRRAGGADQEFRGSTAPWCDGAASSGPRSARRAAREPCCNESSEVQEECELDGAVREDVAKSEQSFKGLMT